jgi:hypothetical protein
LSHYLLTANDMCRPRHRTWWCSFADSDKAAAQGENNTIRMQGLLSSGTPGSGHDRTNQPQKEI